MTTSRIRNERIQRSRAGPAGFTFIELLFVLMTLALLLGITLPRMGRSIERLRTERAAFDAMQLLRYAQATSVVMREPIAVSLDEQRHALRIEVQRDGKSVSLEDRFTRGQAFPRTLTVRIFEDDHGVAKTSEAVRFFPDGTSEPAMISITDEAGGGYRIAVDETTGQVGLQTGPVAP